MLNYIAIGSILAAAVSGPARIAQAHVARHRDVGNAALPILIGRTGHIGRPHRARWRSSIVWWLLYRTHARASRSGPSAPTRTPPATPACGPRLLIVADDGVGGRPGRAGRRDRDPRRRRIYAGRPTARPSASTRSPSRCSGAPTRSASSSRRCCFGAMRAGARLMQIQAGMPVEMVDVLQAVILFFLVADVIVRRVFRLRGRGPALRGGRRRSRRSYGGRRRSADGRQFLYASRSSGSFPARRLPRSTSSPTIAPIILPGRDADRLRRAVRRPVRAIGRRQHRHRGDDAGRRLRRAGSSACWSLQPSGRASRASLRHHAGARSSAWSAAILTGVRGLAAPRLAVDQRPGGPDHQRHDHQHRRVRADRLPEHADRAERRRPAPAVRPVQSRRSS